MKSRSQSHEEMLPELSPSQRTLLGELIDQYELSADTGQVLSLENLCENSPELLPHLISSLRRLRAFDVRLATVPSLPLPERIADYVVLEPLGAGATGMVFRCRQQNPDRDVAVKVLKPLLDADEQQLRFTREIAAIAAIKEEGIAAVYQTGIVEWSGVRCLWIAMELLSGGSVTDFLRRHNTNETDKLQLFGTIARTIRAAHRVGILHRDIKPSNILMSDDGQPHVVDFGIAKLPGTFAHVQQTETGSTSAKGTAAWMAPELLLADSSASADVRSEIFSLGVLLFEMISGRHPYAAEHLSIPQVSARIAQGEQARLKDVYPTASMDLVAFLDRMMAFSVDHRYQNLDDVLSDLMHLQQGEPVRSRRVPLRERVFRWSRRHRGFAASLVALFFAALAIFATLWITSARIRQQSALLASANKELETRSDRLEQQTVNLQHSIQLRDRSISNGALRSLQYVVDNAPFDVQSRLHDPKHFPEERRSFAWRLMNYESSMSRWNLERASGAVRQMTFDPNGGTLYVASDSGELAIYDMATHKKTVGRVGLRADGSLIVRNGHSTLMTISDRQRLVELSSTDGSLVRDYGDTITFAISFAVSSDGELLAGINTERSLFLAKLSDGTVRPLNVTLRKTPAYLWFTDNRHHRQLCRR
jgi:serine/threonine protein kinase